MFEQQPSTAHSIVPELMEAIELQGGGYNVVGLTNASLDSPISNELDVTYAQFRDQTRFWIQRVAVPLLTVIGLFGNSITVIIMTRRGMRSTTNLYLAALAFADMLYLVLTFLLGLSHYPNMAGYKYYTYWKLRPFLMMLTDACSNTSVWLIVTFTIERFIAVKYPMKGKVWCTERRAKMLIVGVFTIGILFAAPVPFEWNVIEKRISLPVDVIRNKSKIESLNDSQLADVRQFSKPATHHEVTDQTKNSNHDVGATNFSSVSDIAVNDDDSKILALDYSDFGRNETYKTIYYWSTAVIFYFIPLFSLMLFNGFLIQSVHHSRRERTKMTRSSASNTSNNETKIKSTECSKTHKTPDADRGLNCKKISRKSNGTANNCGNRAHFKRILFTLASTRRKTRQKRSETGRQEIDSRRGLSEHDPRVGSVATGIDQTYPLMGGNNGKDFPEWGGHFEETLPGGNFLPQVSNESVLKEDLGGQTGIRINGISEPDVQSNCDTIGLKSLITKGLNPDNGIVERGESGIDVVGPLRWEQVGGGAKALGENSGELANAVENPSTMGSLASHSRLQHQQKKRCQQTSTHSTNSQQSIVPASTQERRITIMLIAVVILFLICQIPSAAMLLYTSVREIAPNTNEHALVLAFGNIFNFLMAVNAAGNFILYSFLSKKYRRTFVLIFCSCFGAKRKLNQSNKMVSVRFESSGQSRFFLTQNNNSGNNSNNNNKLDDKVKGDTLV